MNFRTSLTLLTLLSLIPIVGFAQKRMTATGMEFIMHDDQPGPQGEIGDLVSMHLILANDKNETLRSTYEEGKPLLFPIRPIVFEGDLYEAVAIISAGDSASFFIDADSMYQRIFKKPLPANVESGSFLNVTIKALSIKSQRERYDEARRKDSIEKSNLVSTLASQRIAQEAAIEKFLDENGLDAARTTRGVYYVITSEAEGPKPKKGEAVIFDYTGSLLDGTEFENSNQTGRPGTFTLGEYNVIEGWEEAFPNIPLGSWAKIIIPSDLAFGHHSKGPIPAFSTLVFDVHLTGIK